jgi:hypothetical protein
MEQKKVLWILFAVAALLLIVVGVGLIWFLPVKGDETAIAETDGGKTETAAGFDPIEWVRGDENAPGIEPKSEEGEEGDFVVSEELVYGADSETASEEVVTREEADRIVRLVDPAPGSRPPVQQAEPRRVTPPPVRETPKEPEKRLVTEYWIQAGSYASNSRATQVREQLAANGITSTIQTREMESGTYFRVRIGPYVNDEEAAKFLEWVKALDGFKDSYITEVYVRK